MTCVLLGMFDVEKLRTCVSDKFVMMSLPFKTQREIMAKTQVQRNESLGIYVNKDMVPYTPGHLYCLSSGTWKICQWAPPGVPWGLPSFTMRIPYTHPQSCLSLSPWFTLLLFLLSPSALSLPPDLDMQPLDPSHPTEHLSWVEYSLYGFVVALLFAWLCFDHIPLQDLMSLKESKRYSEFTLQSGGK